MYSSTVMYARVSSTKQDTLSQKPELLRWLEKEGIKAQWFEDIGTGRNMTRKGIQSIINGIKGGEVKRVVCVSLNRLGRCASQVWEFVTFCQKHNVTLLCLREGFDLSQPIGRSMCQIIAVLAELGNEIRSEATKAGINAKREQAAREGRVFKTGGSVKGHSLKVTAEKAAAIEALRAQKLSYAKIAKVVGLASRTVSRVILHPRAEYVSRAELARRKKEGK